MDQHKEFTSACTTFNVGEHNFVLRVLKMVGSTFVFLTNAASECLDEVGVAVYLPDTKTVMATTVHGGNVSSESELLAHKLSKRFKRQFFVSCAAQDRMIGPLLERQLCDYIKTHEDQFI